MAKIDLKKLIKNCTFYYFIFGIAIGVIMLIYSLINNNFAWNILDKTYHGLIAGICALLIMPITMGLVGFFHAPLLWYPLIYIYNKIFK